MPNYTYVAKVFTQPPTDAVIRLNGSAVRVGDREPLCVRVSASPGYGHGWRALAVIDHDHEPVAGLCGTANPEAGRTLPRQ
jgi:hypothetical protein